jgi:hypothetical protein
MVQNVSLYIDNILNETNTSNINGTYIFTRYLSEGIHNWSILSYNNDSNPSQSLTRYFTIDYTSPIINFINPTPLNNSYITNNSININISSFDYSDFSTIANFDKSLKGYWSMDYYNSIWIFDNSSYNNSFKFFGEVRANNITSGIRGNGSNFNGVNSYLALDNSYNFTSNNTLSFWAKINVQESQGIIGRNGTSITDYLRFGKNAPTHNQIIYGETNTDTDFIELDFKGVYNALSYDTWYHFVIIEDNNLNWSLWINGLYQTSYTTTNPNITFQRLGNSRNLDFLNGSLDEVMIFNRSLSEKEIKALYNSKVNNFDVPFSGLTEDRHDYIIYEIDTLGNFNQSSMNFIINTTYPVINIVYPQNITYYLTSITSNPNAIRWFNWTASDIGGNLDKCWYSSDNGGTNYSIICNANASFSSAYGTKTLIAWANDTLNHLTREDKTATFKYKIFELNQSFNTPVLENTPQDYYANIYTDSSLSINSVYFNYNGTNYSGGYSVIGNYTRLEKLNFYSPSVITDANNTITWWVLLDDSSRIVLSTNYQIVNNLIYSGVCNSTYPYYLFNLTLKDERTQLDINGTIETDIRFKTSNGTINLFNWTSTLYNTSSYLCSNLPISSGNSYTVDGTIKYYASNENYSAMVEYYNFLNFSYNNNTYYQNISLYDLNTTEGTEFQLTFKDSAFRTRENILIYVYRQYLPEGIFKVVELPKTDSNGQTVLHLVRNDVIYNIIAVDSAGNILGVLNNVIAFCEDYTIGDCKINFQGTTIETDLENYIEDLGLSYTLSFDSATNIISFVFSSDTLQVKNIRLQVISTAVITNRTICDTSLSAITGTLTCDVSSVVNSSSSVYVKIFLDNVEIINESLSLDNSNWNVPGVLFFGFLLLLIIGIMFIESKEGLIIAVILGFIVLISLGIAKGKIIGFTSGVLWLIIVGVILLIKLNKEKKQG